MLQSSIYKHALLWYSYISIYIIFVSQLMYKSFDGDKSRVDDSTLYRTCTAIILTDLWDVSVLSNLLTLLSLTAEHFIGEFYT